MYVVQIQLSNCGKFVRPKIWVYAGFAKVAIHSPHVAFYHFFQGFGLEIHFALETLFITVKKFKNSIFHFMRL